MAAPKGAGSVLYDKARRRYRGRIRLAGTIHRVDGPKDDATAAAREEVRRALAKLADQHRAGQHVDPGAGRILLRDYLPTWLATKLTLRRRAFVRLESDVRLYLVPHLGHLRLGELQPSHLRKLYVQLYSRGGYSGRPLAARTVRNLHRAIYAALRSAQRDGLVAQNVADLAADALPRPPAKRRRAFSASETEAFHAAAQRARSRLAWLFVVKAETGCRIGELLGLEWPRVQWEAGEHGALLVEVQLDHAKDRQATLAQPKSPAGVRPVFLTRRARAALDAQQAQRGADRVRWRRDPRWVDSSLVFASRFGGPLAHSNVSRAFHLLASAAGLPRDASPHWLRHSTATRLAERGLHPAAIAAVLGHADAAFTARTYTHAMDDQRQRAARLLEMEAEHGRTLPNTATEAG